MWCVPKVYDSRAHMLFSAQHISPQLRKDLLCSHILCTNIGNFTEVIFMQAYSLVFSLVYASLTSLFFIVCFSLIFYDSSLLATY